MMHADWFRTVEFPLAWDAYRRLPRHSAYRYEYRQGKATITGRPLYRHCRIPIPPSPAPSETTPALQTLELVPWTQASLTAGQKDRLVDLYQAAFAETVPFPALTKEDQFAAAFSILGGSIAGFDGVPIPQASFVIRSRAEKMPVAAALLTLTAPGNWTDFTDPAWKAAPPKDPVRQQWGHPHLTWLFVRPDFQRQGLGTRLLTQARQQLSQLGYAWLFSTFLVGNNSSLLWHWKQGFELIPRSSEIPSSSGEEDSSHFPTGRQTGH
jgi:GNAT superfamily N-acetyltransferase